jgi:lipopolysaccharide export system permease protein
MVFKQIDRYVGKSFLVSFCGTMCVIGGLYTAFDVMKRLDEIQQGGLAEMLPVLAAYYGRLVPLFLLEIMPGVVLVAGGMVLVRMAKGGELLALRASGTSLYRVTAPVFFWALLVSAGSFGVREVIGPRMLRQRLALDRALDGRIEHRLMVQNASHRLHVYAGDYDFARQAMRLVSVIGFSQSGILTELLQAESASWTPAGALLLKTVQLQRFDEGAAAQSKPSLTPEMTLNVDLTPGDFLQAAEENTNEGMMLQTLAQLWRQMRLHPRVPDFSVQFHCRLATLFTPLILLLVGLPCLVGFEHSVTSRFLGVVVSIALAAGLYALTFAFSSMGNSGAVPPVLSGWLPTLLTGAGGLWLFQAVLT